MTDTKKVIFVLVTALLFCFDQVPTAGCSSVNYRMPIKRMRSIFHAAVENNWNKEKVQKMAERFGGKPPAKRTNDSVLLYKFMDTEFYGLVGVGHPAQQIKVIFDTAWADSWIVTDECPFYTIGCSFKKKFNEKESFTFKELGKQFSLALKSGNITGYLATDTIYLSHLNVTNHTFGAVTNLPKTYAFTPAAGVIGLGLERLSQFNATSFVRNLLLQRRIAKPVFSVYINRHRETDIGGSIFFGGSDKKHYNETLGFLTLRVDGPYYWRVAIDRVEIQYSKQKTEKVCSENCKAIVDTSTMVISGPKSSVQRINSVIGAQRFLFGKYMVPCNKINVLPHIAFVLGGKNFTLTGPDYVQMISYKGLETCISAFVESDGPNNTWTLGGAFLGLYYTRFDLQQMTVGFALHTNQHFNKI